MKKILSLILALVATTTLWAYDFQSGDLYYRITSSSAPYTVEVDDAMSSIPIATIPETVTYNGTTYSVTNIGDYAFYDCSSLTSVTIPNSVTSIGGYAFYRCSALTSVTIPNSVTSIGEGAFGRCESLTSITIPNSVTSIGYAAVSACSSLTSITIPNSVTSIGELAFSDCIFTKENFVNNSVLDAEENNYWGASIGDTEIDGLLIRNDTVIDCRPNVTSVIIPEGVTSIGDYAFSWCSSLTSVTIPNSVTSIGYEAFDDCSSLTSITIPNSVTSIGEWAFAGCSSLTSMVVESSNSTYDSRENCNAIIETATNTLIAGCQNTIIPNSITSIGDGAFCRCESLTSITIPNSVTSIGSNAFAYCSSLTSITIPNSVTSIGNWAFRDCSSLTSITIPNSVTSIGNETFWNCYSLTSITIPNSVTSIGRSAFYACSSLTSVTIPNSVTSIGEVAFSGCIFAKENFVNHSVLDAEENNYWGARIVDTEIDGLIIRNDTVIDCRRYVTSAIIPNSVTSIGDYAFSDCFSLTSITIPNSVTSIGEWAFGVCSSLTSITIPNSVTSMGYGAFNGCDALTSIVVESSNSTYDSRENCNAIIETATNTLIAGCQNTIIPNSITSIGDYAFCECFSLTSITIPNSVTSIGDYAFGACFSLTSITIPNSVTSIGEWAFYYCLSLKTVICEAIEVPELGNDVFYDMPLSEATLYVPAQSLDDYKAAEQWKEFGTILPLDKAPSAVENTRLPITNSTKLLRNGQLLILRDGKTYTITGQKL